MKGNYYTVGDILELNDIPMINEIINLWIDDGRYRLTIDEIIELGVKKSTALKLKKIFND